TPGSLRRRSAALFGSSAAICVRLITETGAATRNTSVATRVAVMVTARSDVAARVESVAAGPDNAERACWAGTGVGSEKTAVATTKPRTMRCTEEAPVKVGRT